MKGTFFTSVFISIPTLMAGAMADNINNSSTAPVASVNVLTMLPTKGGALPEGILGNYEMWLAMETQDFGYSTSTTLSTKTVSYQYFDLTTTRGKFYTTTETNIAQYPTTTYTDKVNSALAAIKPRTDADNTSSSAGTNKASLEASKGPFPPFGNGKTHLSIGLSSWNTTVTKTVSWSYVDLTTTQGSFYTTTKTPYYISAFTTYHPTSAPSDAMVPLKSTSTSATPTSIYKAAAPSLGGGVGGVLAAVGVAALF